MIISEETTVLLATDLLASTLPMALAEEVVLVEPPCAAGAPDLPAPGSPEHITMEPPSSKMGALLEMTTAPLSSPTTELVSTGMTQVISFHVYYYFIIFIFSYTYFIELDIILFLLEVQVVAFTHRYILLPGQNQKSRRTTSVLVGRLGSSAEEFDTDYFTPIPSSAKATNPSSDELGSNDRMQPSVIELQEELIPP